MVLHRERHEDLPRRRALHPRHATREESDDRLQHVVWRRGVPGVHPQSSLCTPAQQNGVVVGEGDGGAGWQAQAKQALGERDQAELQLRALIRQCPVAP